MRGVADEDEAASAPTIQHGVAIARPPHPRAIVDRLHPGARLGPQRSDFVEPRRDAGLLPPVELARAQAPEETQARRRIARLRTDRQQADHLARRDIAL